MDELTNGTDAAAVVADAAADAAVVETKPARKPSRRAATVPAMPRTIKSFADLVAVGRNVTPATWDAIVARFTRDHGVTHAARNVGRFTGSRIVDFQNVFMADNHGLDDCQIAAVYRIEHPAAVGALYTRDAATAVSIVRGIRAEYNRNGHGAKTETWRTVRAERFGPATFDWPKPAATKTA